MVSTKRAIHVSSNDDASIPTEVAVTSPTLCTLPSDALLSDVVSHRICSVSDYQALAKQTLPLALYEYLASGSDDEQTLAANRSAWNHWFLRPRVMRPVSHISTTTTICFPNVPSSLSELRLSMPLFVSPAGVHALCEPIGGECTTAQACADAGILFGLSQHSTRSIEEVAGSVSQSTKAMNYYQAYLLKDRSMTTHLIQRAINAGYQGIFLTVDSVRFGYREADDRNGFDALPPPHRLVNYDDVGVQTKNHVLLNSSSAKDWSRSPTSPPHEMTTESNGLTPRNNLEATYNGRQHKSWDQNIELMFAQDATWDDVRLIKRQFPTHPLIIKGIMTAEDAILAVEAGADGIMVSNHGGRQQDGCLASIDALPHVVAAVRSMRPHTPVFLDGGVRRGTDILKALALGASAVGIGKPVFFALSVGGKAAVSNLFRIFQKELEASMALTGCQTVADISSAIVTRHPYETDRSGNFVRAKL